MPSPAGAGALCGAMFFGTANALLSGVHALGFSMVGRHRRRHRRRSKLSSASPASAARPASSSPRPSPRPWRSAGWAASSPASPISPTARRPACPGASISATASRRHPVQLYEIAGHGRDVRRADPALHGARSLLARQRLLPDGRLVWAAALRLGILQALCNRDRAVQPLPCGLPGPGPVRCRR